MIRAIYVEYTSAHRDQIQTHLFPLLRRLFPQSPISLTIVDTSGKCAPYFESSVSVIKGDNSSREFSGWQTAIDQQGFQDDDVICLCNDTFARNYGTKFLSWFDTFEVNNALRSHKAVGYVDQKQVPAILFGTPVKQWIRTNIFFIAATDFRKALPLTLPDSDDRIFSMRGLKLFRPHTNIDDNTQRWLEAWLTKAPSLPGESKGHWYQAAELNESNRAFLNLKAKSIICELLLSARLQANGVSLFDIRKSKRRAFGAFYVLERLGWLNALRTLRRQLLR